jgi:hypothetical protein
MPKINFGDGAHWYACRDGEPRAEHDATLREARKQMLYASPTSIDKQEFVNEFLQKWKTEQVALAAAENPKQAHEDDEAYMNRIYQLSLEKSTTAADFGKEVHAAIEHYPMLPGDPKLVPFLDLFGAWYDANVFTVEASEEILVDHDIGVAGRSDKIVRGHDGNLYLDDYKTQGVKVDDKGRDRPVFYDSWCRQLSFYSVAYAKKVGIFPNIPICRSIIINSKQAQPPWVKVWTKEEIAYAYKNFVLATWRFYTRKNYFPMPNGIFQLEFGVPLPI